MLEAPKIGLLRLASKLVPRQNASLLMSAPLVLDFIALTSTIAPVAIGV